jgi:hypothetical protein
MKSLLLADQASDLPSPTEMVPMPLPHRPEPRFSRSIDFAALPTAIMCTQMFVASTLRLWGAQFIEADTEVLAVELVRHSVQTCGVVDPDVRLSALDDLTVIHLRLLCFERTIGIEVWDKAETPARMPKHDSEGESHGLGLVDARARGWGSSITPQGRVVWAELDIFERTTADSPLSQRKSSPKWRDSTRSG